MPNLEEVTPAIPDIQFPKLMIISVFFFFAPIKTVRKYVRMQFQQNISVKFGSYDSQ